MVDEDGQYRLFSEGEGEEGTEVRTAAQRLATSTVSSVAERLRDIGARVRMLSSQAEARALVGEGAEYSKKVNSTLDIEWHSVIPANLMVDNSLLTTSIFQQGGAFISDELKDVEYPNHKTVYSVALCSGNWYFYSVDENYSVEVFNAVEGVSTPLRNVIEKAYEYGINETSSSVLAIMQEYELPERISRGVLDYIERRANKENNDRISGQDGGEGRLPNSIGAVRDNSQRVNAGHFFRGFPREVGEYAKEWGVDNFRAAEMYYIMRKSQENGTFMKAPNGNASNLNERQWLQVRTREFKTWFGDWQNDPKNASKVIDENGEPRIMFHGTKNTSEKDIRKNGFTKHRSGLEGSISLADYYQSYYDGENGFNNANIPVFVNLRNPFVMGNKQDHNAIVEYQNVPNGYDGWIKLGVGNLNFNAHNDNRIIESLEDSLFNDEENFVRKVLSNDEIEELKNNGVTETVRQKSQDYINAHGIQDCPVEEIQVHESTQVKSAMYNRGGFYNDVNGIEYSKVTNQQLSDAQSFLYRLGGIYKFSPISSNTFVTLGAGLTNRIVDKSAIDNARNTLTDEAFDEYVTTIEDYIADNKPNKTTVAYLESHKEYVESVKKWNDYVSKNYIHTFLHYVHHDIPTLTTLTMTTLTILAVFCVLYFRFSILYYYILLL